MADDRGINHSDFVERFRLKGVEQAEAEGEADTLEHIAKRIFAEIVNQSETSVAKAESLARTHERYDAARIKAIKAHTRASVLKAELEAMRIGFEAWRTRNANRRAETKIQ